MMIFDGRVLQQAKNMILYLFTYKTHHFLQENMLVWSKSAQNSGCVL